MPDVYSRAVRRASEIIGDEALGILLRASRAEIDGWLSGKLEPPQAVFLRCVDIVVQYDTKLDAPPRN